MLYTNKTYISVELPGVEPGSKQSAKLLSTCLAFSWLSGAGRQKATQPKPYSLWFSNCHRDVDNLILPFLMPGCGTPEGRASRGAIGRLILGIKRPMRNYNRCHLCGVSIWFIRAIHSKSRHAYHPTVTAVKTGQPRWLDWIGKDNTNSPCYDRVVE